MRFWDPSSRPSCIVYPFYGPFGSAYNWITDWKSHGFQKWAPELKEELLGAVLMLPLAKANLRAPISSLVSATDATVTKAGSCEACVPKAVARFMYKRSEMKGERVRLDWTTEELKWSPCAMQKPTGYLDELVASLPWKKPRASRFARNAHINIQELVAAADEIRRRAQNGETDKRIILVLDSRVAVGALGKGRSSLKCLNRCLRMFTQAFLCYGLVACPVWVSTKFNPADAPSRNAPLPTPGPRPPWAKNLRLNNGSVGLRRDRSQQNHSASKEKALTTREYYAGYGGLSDDLGNIGFSFCK